MKKPLPLEVVVDSSDGFACFYVNGHFVGNHWGFVMRLFRGMKSVHFKLSVVKPKPRRKAKGRKAK